MIIVNLKGGLGNQMFQYATGKRLAVSIGATLKLDTTFLNKKVSECVTYRNFELTNFHVTEDIATTVEIREVKNLKNKLIRKLFPGFSGNPYVTEKHFHFDPQILQLQGSRYLEGHWVSEKYFEDITDTLREIFIPRSTNQLVQKFADRIQNTNSIAIQIRRGDYVTNAGITKVHGVLPLDYFYNGIKQIQEQIENPTFFIFSDDIQWCRENLKLSSAVYVEEELSPVHARSSDYLYLMSLCSHFIISNSTFGWWGAWLATKQNKIVIAPQHWFASSDKNTKDIYPSSWIKI